MKIIKLLEVELFREIQPINEDVDSKILSKVIYNSQETNIQEFLGTELYKKILDLVDTGEITDPGNAKYKLLLDDHVVKVLSYYAYVDSIPHMTYQFTDKGVQERSGNHSTTGERAAVKEKIGNAREQAEFHANLMVGFLCKNSRDYPEYGKFTDGVQAKTEAFFCGIELDYEGHDFNPLERP